MKKLLSAIVLMGVLGTPVLAEASKEELAQELVLILYSDVTTLNPSARAMDPAKRDVYYRQVATDFYADRFNEVQLTDLVGFFRTSAGARLLKSQPRIEREVIVVVFSDALRTGATLPLASESRSEDQRMLLAAELMQSPYIADRITPVAFQYDIMRLSPENRPKKADPKSVERIRVVYTERYARRFGAKLLQSIVDFYSTKLGKRFSKGQIELPGKLLKAAERFDG